MDSHFSPPAWKDAPVNRGGIGIVRYPLSADLTKNITRADDVLVNDAVALRGSLLTDQEGIVRHQVVNDAPLGRNIDEMLRMIDALQFTEKHGKASPAGWQDGRMGMIASVSGEAE